MRRTGIRSRSAMQFYRIFAVKYGYVNSDASYGETSCDGSPGRNPCYSAPESVLSPQLRLQRLYARPAACYSPGRGETESRRKEKERKRVPCSNRMTRELRTVYATVRQRLHLRVGECCTLFHEPASLVVRSPCRHTGKSGEQPHSAVSGVGDPRERHALIRVRPLGTIGVLGS